MTRLALILLVAAAAPLVAQGRGKESTDVSRDHRPPPGMCRIWIDGVPAARQPAPTDCPTAISKRPPNARVIFGEELRDQRRQRNLRPEAQRGTQPAAPRLAPRDAQRDAQPSPQRDTPRPAPRDASPPPARTEGGSRDTGRSRPREPVERRPASTPPPRPTEPSKPRS